MAFAASGLPAPSIVVGNSKLKIAVTKVVVFTAKSPCERVSFENKVHDRSP
jgi:hypothetical protein